MFWRKSKGCQHDWVEFRRPKTKFIREDGDTRQKGTWYYVYDGIIVVKSRGTNRRDFCDYTCSLCHEMDLKMQKAIVKTQKKAVADAKAAEIKKIEDEKIAIRRDAAREFALRFISMKQE